MSRDSLERGPLDYDVHLQLGRAGFCPSLSRSPEKGSALQTVAERSGYRATARYDDVMAWCREFSKDTPNAHLAELGRTAEGRSIPLMIVADPPVTPPAEAAHPGKLVVLHHRQHPRRRGLRQGGPADARPRGRREAAHPLLKDLILAVAPIYNADGNERVSKTNRPGQVGPEEGMGQRGNARGLDLNRDFIKLEAPETRALVRFLNEWDPHLFIDTHTTNGSYHRYTITYDGPKNPAGDPRVIGFMRQTFFPEVTTAFEKPDEPEGVLLRELRPRPHPVDDLPGRSPVRHDLRRVEEPAVGPVRGVFLCPVPGAGARRIVASCVSE